MFPDSLHVDALLMDDITPTGTNPTEDDMIEGDVQLDLASYISSYHGYIYYRRLFFISEKCPSLRPSALRLAHDYIKKFTFDTVAYNKVFFMLAEQKALSPGLTINSGSASSHDIRGGLTNISSQLGQGTDTVLLPSVGELVASGSPLSDAAKLTLTSVLAGENVAHLSYDAPWEENARRQSATLLDHMDTELKNYKANSIKESIRRQYDEIGHLYLKMGRLDDARKCYLRTRDYCTSEQQEISMCLNVIKLSIFQNEWAHVSATVTRAYGLSELRDVACTNTSNASTSIAATHQIATTAAHPSTSASTSLRGRPTAMSGRSVGMGNGAADRGTIGTSGHLRQVPSIAESFSGGGSQGYRDAIAQARTALAIAAGLLELSSRNFREAALKFVQVNPDHIESPTSSLLSQSDVGLLITLCSLASFDRSELTTLVLGAPTMRLLLETEPVCRDMLQAFHQADYASLLGRLSAPSPHAGRSDRRVSTALRDQLRLDLFLADRFVLLTKEIRARSLCQYFSPYSSASLCKMARAFDTTVVDLENELATLIQEGSINARIDSHKQVLRVVSVDQRCMTFARAMRLADEYEKRTHTMILRLCLARQKLVCQNSRDEAEAVLNYLS